MGIVVLAGDTACDTPFAFHSPLPKAKGDSRKKSTQNPQIPNCLFFSCLRFHHTAAALPINLYNRLVWYKTGTL